MEIVEINKDDLVGLVRDQEYANALYSEGVDNWDWYDEALEEYRSKDDADFEAYAEKYIQTPIEKLFLEIKNKVGTYPTIGYSQEEFIVSFLHTNNIRTIGGKTIREALQNVLSVLDKPKECE